MASADYVLWFDARSAASRRALELLRARGVEPELRRFLEEPPGMSELEALFTALGRGPHELIREHEDEYQSLRLSPRTPRGDLVRALARHPRILAGPFLVHGDRAVQGLPPERVLDLLPARARTASG